MHRTVISKGCCSPCLSAALAALLTAFPGFAASSGVANLFMSQGVGAPLAFGDYVSDEAGLNTD